MKITTLKNGINTVFCNKNNQELTIIGFVCKTGYINEYKSFPSGITLIIEKLFLRGTHKNTSQKKIWQAIDILGGKWYSETDSEITSFYLHVPHENQFKAISLISEIIQKSYFEDTDIENCKNELIDELKSIRKGTNVNFGLENLYTCFPYSSKKYGTIDQIMSINQNTILDYLARQFRPSNCYLVVSGNYQQKQCLELIEQEWGYWLPTVRKADEIYFDNLICKNDLPKIPFLQSAKTDTDLNINFILNDGIIPKELCLEEKPDLNLIPQIYDNYLERLAIYVMINELLVGGNTGQFYNKLIHDDRLVNHIQSEIVQFSYSGCLSIYANIDNQNFNTALTILLTILEDTKNTLISSTELLKLKELTKFSFISLKNDLLNSTIFNIKHFVLSGYTIDINDILMKINYIENTQIRSFCIEIFNTENLSMSLIGTNKEAKYLEKLITSHLG